MKFITLLISTPLLFLITACEDKKDDLDSPSNAVITVIEVITSDIDDSAYFYNFTSASEDTSTWHLTAQNLPVGNYYMPTIILDSTKYKSELEKVQKILVEKKYVSLSINFNKISFTPLASIIGKPTILCILTGTLARKDAAIPRRPAFGVNV